MPKIVALLIVTAYAIYFLITPPLTIHDEPAHVKIIVGVSQGKYPSTGKSKGNYDDTKELGANKKLAESLNYIDHPYQLPTFTKVSYLKASEQDYNMEGIYSHQAYSPPVYYVVGAAFHYISQLTDNLLSQFYILRLTSAVFYFGTVTIAWKILLLFFKKKKTASAILIFFSINPLVLKMGIGINPDIALTFFSLCFLYILLKTSPKAFDTKHTIYTAIISALATLTKVSGVFTNAVFLLYIFANNKFHKKTLRLGLIFQCIFFVITVPWFLFMYNRYGTIFPEPFSSMCPADNGPFYIKLLETFTDFRFTIMQYSGFMGEGWPFPFEWFFASYVLLFVMLLIAGLIFILRQKKILYGTLLFYAIPMSLFLVMLSIQYRVKAIDCDIQGRYMMPLFFVLCLVVYWGVFAITKNENRSAKILSGFAIFHYLFILFTVLLIRYYV